MSGVANNVAEAFTSTVGIGRRFISLFFPRFCLTVSHSRPVQLSGATAAAAAASERQSDWRDVRLRNSTVVRSTSHLPQSQSRRCRRRSICIKQHRARCYRCDSGAFTVFKQRARFVWVKNDILCCSVSTWRFKVDPLASLSFSLSRSFSLSQSQSRKLSLNSAAVKVQTAIGMTTEWREGSQQSGAFVLRNER